MEPTANIHVLHLVCGDPAHMNRLRFQLDLARNHWATDVLVTDGRYFPGGDLAEPGATADTRDAGWPRKWRKLCQTVRVLVALVRHPADILHAHEHGTLFFVFVWCALLRRRVMWDPHDMYLHTSTHDRKVHRIKWKRFFERYLVRKATPIAVVSSGMRDMYERAYPDARIERLRSFPSGFARDGTVTQRDPDIWIRQREQAANGKLRLVYPGLLMPSRIEPAFIEAMAGLQRVTLDLYGRDRSGRYDAEIREFIAARKIKNVRLVGPYAPQDLGEILARYHLGVMPFVVDSENMDYCMPNKFYQCMAACLPVVVSDMKELGAEVRVHRLGHVFRAGAYGELAAWLAACDPTGLAYRSLIETVLVYRDTRMNVDGERDALCALYKALA